jgi:hypothetical protein
VTLEEVRAIDREFLTPAEVAAVIGCDPHGIRVWARERPGALGFPVIVLPHRTKIPKRGFIAYMEGKRA